MDYINKILCGDNLEILPKLPDESVNCVVTSPPYWGLRDYGIEPIIWDGDKDCKHEWKIEITKRPNASGGKTDWAKEKLATKGVENYQEFVDYNKRETTSDFCLKCNAWRGSLGLEPTFELYIKHLCDIFDEVKRVLRKDGTCWVNLGDSYNGNKTGNTESRKNPNVVTNSFKKENQNNVPTKSLCLIPQRFAIEMVNRGWILRNTIIWKKPNCMPSSAKDRFTVDFEYVYFFVKSKKYFFEQQFEEHKNGYKTYLNKRGNNLKYEESNYNANHLSRDSFNPQGRNKRAVWTVPNDDPILALEQLANRIAEYKKLHPDIDVWWLEEEVCKVLVNLTEKGAVWTIPTKPFPEAHFAVYPEALIEPMIRAGCPKGGIVLDSFIGAGTTAVVAKKLGRKYTGIEIKQEYIDMADKRIRKIPELLF